ncbi:MAG TPA: adenylate/guanylate cyclase domain-containing protein, partial [Nitrososphaera sp.]
MSEHDYPGNDNVSTLLAIDKDRFEERAIGGQTGYFDKVEKLFIPKRSFSILIEELLPSVDRTDIHRGLDLRGVFERSRSRVSRNLKQIYMLGKDSYSQVFLSYLSRSFLLKNRNTRVIMAILYVDLVGSTAMTAVLPPDQLVNIVRIFCQEMSIMISKRGGYVLKYAGDAVIGYFPNDPDTKTACENATSCAFDMRRMIEDSLNVVLSQHNYPKLRTRIAVDVGENQILVLGSDPDLLGHVISRAAKIMGRVKPNQIVIGGNVFKTIGTDLKGRFTEIEKYN